MPREEKFLQHPAQRRLDKHIKTRTMNVKNTGLLWLNLVSQK